jgi:hypothetical protein
LDEELKWREREVKVVKELSEGVKGTREKEEGRKDDRKKEKEDRL